MSQIKNTQKNISRSDQKSFLNKVDHFAKGEYNIINLETKSIREMERDREEEKDIYIQRARDLKKEGSRKKNKLCRKRKTKLSKDRDGER